MPATADSDLDLAIKDVQEFVAPGVALSWCLPREAAEKIPPPCLKKR
jgi:hypothetical protein